MVTVNLSQLEGEWKPVFERRLKLLEDGIAAVTRVWKPLVPDVTGMVRAALGMSETIAPDPAAVAAGLVAFSELESNQALIDALAEWIRRAYAEGWTGALGQAAHNAGAVGFDFDLAFTDAYEALASLGEINAQALATLQATVTGTVNDLGRLLGQMVANGATYDELVAAAEDLLSNASSVSYWVDVALSAGMSQGALNLYTSEGVATADWITAGDQRVCAECESNEEGNPWTISDGMPVPPQHGRCRCAITTSQTINSAAWSQYLAGAEEE